MLHDYRVRQRDFLLKISRAITSQLELSEVLRLVLQASVAMLAGESGLIALRDETTGQISIRAVTEIDDEQIPVLDEKLQELIDASGEQFDQEYLNVKLREMAIMINRKLRQSVALPLSFAHDPLGILIVFKQQQTVVTDNDIQVLQSFADQAAIAVHNAQLYAHIDQERKRLAAILEYSGDGVMILDTNLDILQVNRAFERMTGWDSDEILGLNQDDVIQWEQIEQPDLRDAIREGWFKNALVGKADETVCCSR